MRGFAALQAEALQKWLPHRLWELREPISSPATLKSLAIYLAHQFWNRPTSKDLHTHKLP